MKSQSGSGLTEFKNHNSDLGISKSQFGSRRSKTINPQSGSTRLDWDRYDISVVPKCWSRSKLHKEFGSCSGEVIEGLRFATFFENPQYCTEEICQIQCKSLNLDGVPQHDSPSGSEVSEAGPSSHHGDPRHRHPTPGASCLYFCCFTSVVFTHCLHFCCLYNHCLYFCCLYFCCPL